MLRKSLVTDGVLIFNNGKVELVGQSNSLNKKSKEDIRTIKKIINDSQHEIIPIRDLHKKSSLNPKIINELVFFINKRQEVLHHRLSFAIFPKKGKQS